VGQRLAHHVAEFGVLQQFFVEHLGRSRQRGQAAERRRSSPLLQGGYLRQDALDRGKNFLLQDAIL